MGTLSWINGCTFALLSMWVLGCAQPDSKMGGPDVSTADLQDMMQLDRMDAFVPAYVKDDTLRINHIQALGTHNSYHLRSHIDILPWRYNHLPLDEQLDLQGVRQFELDLYQNEAGTLEVYHIGTVDDGTTCETLSICLTVMKDWSDAHLGHHPLLVLLEPKRYRESAEDTLQRIESILEETWSRERLVTPDLVQRDAANIRDGLAQSGWPVLGSVRGRLLVILHTSGALRDAYLNAAGGTEARLMFPDAYGDLNASFAAYHSMNNPISSQDEIRALVAAGHLVRTRADADGEESESLDYTKSEAALRSGAHFISTDFPYAGTEDEYGFVIPEGTPSRCNPISAPSDCNPSDLEDPASLGP